MKRKNITAILAAGMLSLYSTAYAQEGRVGINTTDPKTTLDITGKTDTSGNLLTTDMTGLQAPRLTRAELTAKGNALYGADQKGALVYITDISGGDATSQRINITAAGYYYFDGTVWQAVANSASAAATEPWYNVATGAGATANTQNIYQMGKVGINKVPGTYDQLVVKDGATDKWFNYLNLGDADNRSVAEIYNGNTDGQSVLSIKTYDGASNSSVLGLALQGFTNWNMVALGSDNTFNIGRSGGFGLEDGRFITITENGNVGIGTTTPNAKLQVGGDSYIGSVPNPATSIPGDNLYVANNQGDDNVSFRIDGWNNDLAIAAHSKPGGTVGGSISLRTAMPGDTEANRVKILPNGNVGIGLNLTATNKLHVVDYVDGNPLRLEGLQAGAATDEVLTTDATGVVKKLTGSALATAVKEPWYDVATNAGATANTQNIYQMGKVGINKVPGTYDQLVVKDGATDKWFNYLNLGDADNRSIAEIYNGNTDGQSVLSIKTNDGASNSSILALALQGFTNWNMVALGSDNTFNIGRSGGFGLEQGRFMTITETGNVGIGTATPTQKLETIGRIQAVTQQVVGSGYGAYMEGSNAQQAGVVEGFNWGIGTAHLLLNRNGGNVGIGMGMTATPSEKLHVNGTILSSGVADNTGIALTSNYNGSYLSFNNDGTSSVYKAYIQLLKPGVTVTPSEAPGCLLFTNTVGDFSFQIGKVGIGISTPTEPLHVIGNIKATGSFISGTTTYPDYVLENYVDGESNMNPNYTRKTLNEVETFIKENKHLPGVTPAKDLEKTEAGYNFNVTELSTQTLEKVEELYLHVIEQQKQIEALKAELKELKGK